LGTHHGDSQIANSHPFNDGLIYGKIAQRKNRAFILNGNEHARKCRFQRWMPVADSRLGGSHDTTLQTHTGDHQPGSRA
jgi:hypothetical protein